jgi:hypothetical protein
MTLASSKNLRSAIDPKVRDYIDAKLQEEISPIRDDLSDLSCAISEVRDADLAGRDTIGALVEKIHQVLKLSRGRVEQIAAKLGDN